MAHIITAVIGSGVLSLAWSTSQLGWIAGPISMLCFAIVTYVSAFLLSDCHRSPHPVTGTRNYSYMDAVRVNLGTTLNPTYSYQQFFVLFHVEFLCFGAISGEKQTWVCGFLQYFSMYGTGIAYTITTSTSLK